MQRKPIYCSANRTENIGHIFKYYEYVIQKKCLRWYFLFKAGNTRKRETLEFNCFTFSYIWILDSAVWKLRGFIAAAIFNARS